MVRTDSTNRALSDLGARIRQARRRRGLSQAQLAERADMSLPTISRIERGLFNSSVLTIVALAKALDVRAGVLLGEGELSAPVQDALELLERQTPEVQATLVGVLRAALGVQRG